MCKNHRVKRAGIISDIRNGTCHPEVCVECDPYIAKLSKQAIMAPICICLICVGFVIFAIIMFPKLQSDPTMGLGEGN